MRVLLLYVFKFEVCFLYDCRRVAIESLYGFRQIIIGFIAVIGRRFVGLFEDVYKNCLSCL